MKWFRQSWPAVFLVGLSACQAMPEATPHPELVLAPTNIEPSLAPTETPLKGLIPPREIRSFRVAQGEAMHILLSNASAEKASVTLGVDPVTLDEPSPAPTQQPQASNEPAPEPPVDPPFGQGFSAVSLPFLTGATRVPPTRRVAEAQTEPREIFWINNGDATLAGDRQRPAQRRLNGPHATFFVDTEADKQITQSAIERLSNAFEGQIRPKLTPIFGEPPHDANGLTIVLSNWIGEAPNRKGMMGYFWPRDILPQGGSGEDLRQHSNQRQVLFISTKLLEQPDVTACGTLAHEYQHLLMFTAKSRAEGSPHTEETWLDEGLSMLAMDLAGYGLHGGDRFVSGEVEAFRKTPVAYSLTDWSHNPNGYSYGLSYLFVRYLVDRFGMGIVREIQDTPMAGVDGLEFVMNRRGTHFKQVFVDWASATWQSVDGLTPTRLGVPQSSALRPWTIAPLEVTGPRTLVMQSGDRPVVALTAP